MRSRTTHALMVVSALSAAALFAQPASAQQSYDGRTRVAYRGPETARLRYGIAAEGGGLFVPDVASLAVFGVQGQVGVQFDDRVGLYAAPSFAFVRGEARGIHLGGALMVDFTLNDVFTLGIGPDVAAFAAMSQGGLAGGALYGLRMRMATQPVIYIAADGVRRDAFTIGFDVRLYTGGGGGLVTPRRIASSDLVVAPMITLGYQSF